jgi:DNA-binding response OmpR family regulator
MHPSSWMTVRVLVVEDDRELRKLIGVAMAGEGYLVTEAVDAPAMLRAVLPERESPDEAFDLIITDVWMPGQSGLDALARLREGGCHTPVVVVSSFPSEVVKRRVLELGGVLVGKPFSLDNLRVVVGRMLSVDEEL